MIAEDPESETRVYKVGVGKRARVTEVCSDMRRVDFNVLDSSATLYQAKGEAIIIEQLLHRDLTNYKHAVSKHRQFPGYTELFNMEPDFDRVKRNELLARFKQGDRWHIRMDEES